MEESIQTFHLSFKQTFKLPYRPSFKWHLHQRKELLEKAYGGPRCQDTKTGSNKSYFPPFRLLFVLNGLRSCLVKNTLRQEFGNQVPDEGAPDYKT